MIAQNKTIRLLLLQFYCSTDEHLR